MAACRSVYVGQSRLARLQVVNWGTFNGYKDFPIDERGVLFTGPSGSGKSSLMDAHSVVSLPVNDWRFNASSDLTAKGARLASRTVADYVRGAWEENDDGHGQYGVRYLRGGKPTWSAIAATYDDGAGSVTTGVVIKWFRGVETDMAAMKTLHQIHDGHFSLTELFEWAEQGFDTGRLKRTLCHAAYPVSHDDYIGKLAKRIGVGTSRNALSLLGKAKALKNVGDLNYFIRQNMLDLPETFSAARKMVDQFKPLDEAFQTAQRAHLQEGVLREVPSNWRMYQESKTTAELAGRLLETGADIYLRGVHIRVLEAEIEAFEKDLNEFSVQEEDARRRAESEEKAYLALVEQVKAESVDLDKLSEQLDAARRDADTRKQNYGRYQDQVALLGLACPVNRHEFSALLNRLLEVAGRADAAKRRLAPELYDAYERTGKLRARSREKNQELESLTRTGSLIPLRERRQREFIAAGARVPVEELPYAAELLDMADGQERWRPAAEKVLRHFGLRLLVPERFKDPVRQFIDTNDMGAIIEYSVVGGVSAHQPRPDPRTLAGKVAVDVGHPCGPWLLSQLVQRFAHVCVESARDLDDPPLAVTVHGTVKRPGGHYRKDDRPEVNSPSSYVLGMDPAAKVAALEVEIAQLADEVEAAQKVANDLSDRSSSFEKTATAATQLQSYDSWSQLDHWTSSKTVDDLERRISEIRQGSTTLRHLEQERDQAKTRWDRELKQHSAVEHKIELAGAAKEELAQQRDQERDRPHTITDEPDRAYLDEVLAELDTTVTSASFAQLRLAFKSALKSRKATAEGRHGIAFTKVKVAIDGFLKQWPDSAPDNSGDVERSGGDFAALHAEIQERSLPQAMAKFQRLITDEAVPSIGILQRAIEKAGSDIAQRIDMVNASLQRIEFNEGTHLQIASSRKDFEEAKEFRKLVDRLFRDSAKSRRNPRSYLDQFTLIQKIMARFTGDDPESQRWRTNILDVRNAYTFYGREVDGDGTTVQIYRNTSNKSGGEQEKLVAFSLAAALSYNLANASSDGRPKFGTLMLDEAFCKSDETFSAQSLAAFDTFGFQLLIAAPIRMAGVLEPFIGQAILVEKRTTPDGARSHGQTATFGELATHPEAETEGLVRASA